MTYVSTETQGAVASALINRRKELRDALAYWSDLTASPSAAPVDIQAEANTRAFLAATEGAIIELDKRVVPWLHLHPDCCDLFAGAAPGSAEEVPA